MWLILPWLGWLPIHEGVGGFNWFGLVDGCLDCADLKVGALLLYQPRSSESFVYPTCIIGLVLGGLYKTKPKHDLPFSCDLKLEPKLDSWIVALSLIHILMQVWL